VKRDETMIVDIRTC